MISTNIKLILKCAKWQASVSHVTSETPKEKCSLDPSNYIRVGQQHHASSIRLALNTQVPWLLSAVGAPKTLSANSNSDLCQPVQ